MSKRSTTGMPKPGSGKPKPQPEQQTGVSRYTTRLIDPYKSKAEREAQTQRLIILGVGIAVAFALIILVIALVVDQLVTPNQVVAEVNGEAITVAEFRDRVRFERALLSEQLNEGIALFASFGLPSEQIIQQLSQQPPYSTYLSELSISDQLGNRVLNEMIENELIEQRAAELGITVSDEEVQERINEFFGYDPLAALSTATPTPEPSMTPTPFVSPTPSLTPNPTATPQETFTPSPSPFPSATPTATPDATQRAEIFDETRDVFYSNISGLADVSNETITDYFRARALRVKLRNAVLEVDEEADPTTTYVNVRHILVATEEDAQNVIAALEAGESFAALAQQLSTDEGSGAQGGELGWSPTSRYVEEFADAINALEIGEISEPVQTEFGFHIIQVRGREEREATELEYENALDVQFEAYIDELRAAEGTNIEIYDVWTSNVPQEPVFIPRGL